MVMALLYPGIKYKHQLEHPILTVIRHSFVTVHVQQFSDDRFVCMQLYYNNYVDLHNYCLLKQTTIILYL